MRRFTGVGVECLKVMESKRKVHCDVIFFIIHQFRPFGRLDGGTRPLSIQDLPGV